MSKLSPTITTQSCREDNVKHKIVLKNIAEDFKKRGIDVNYKSYQSVMYLQKYCHIQAYLQITKRFLDIKNIFCEHVL